MSRDESSVELISVALNAGAWVVGKPLLFFVLVPLSVGIAVERFAEPVALRLYPFVKKTTDIATMVMLVAMAIAYGKGFTGAIGSYAIGTLVLFVGVVGPGHDQTRLGPGTRAEECPDHRNVYA